MLSPEQRAQLRALIAGEPDLADLAKAGNHSGLQAALSGAHHSAKEWQPVPRKTFTAWATGIGLWTACHRISLTPATAETPGQMLDLMAVARTVLDLRHDLLDWLDMELPVIHELAFAFRSANLMTEEQEAQMLALGERPATRAEAAFGVAVTLDDVSLALTEVTDVG